MNTTTTISLYNTTTTKGEFFDLLSDEVTELRLYNVQGLDDPEVAAAISRLKGLKHLYIENSDIGTADTVLDLNQCTDLEWLSIRTIDLRYLPKIDSCTELKTIMISVRSYIPGDHIKDKLEAIGQYTIRNTLADVDWSKLTKLRTLDLCSNGIEGTIPDSIGTLTSLTTLDLSFNRLTGSVPKTVSRLKNLECIKLSYNKLSTGLDSIKAMPNLSRIEVQSNLFTGKIPDSLFRTGSKCKYTNVLLYGNSFDEQVLPPRLRKGITVHIDSNISVPDDWCTIEEDSHYTSLIKV